MMFLWQWVADKWTDYYEGSIELWVLGSDG